MILTTDRHSNASCAKASPLLAFVWTKTDVLLTIEQHFHIFSITIALWWKRYNQNNVVKQPYERKQQVWFVGNSEISCSEKKNGQPESVTNTFNKQPKEKPKNTPWNVFAGESSFHHPIFSFRKWRASLHHFLLHLCFHLHWPFRISCTKRLKEASTHKISVYIEVLQEASAWKSFGGL